MRHPFQRAGNTKDTVRTPFQAVLVREIRDYSEGGERMSGRKLSMLLGKSANHISQMLNDSFVPSGAAILEIAETLGLSQERLDELIRAAMETKGSQRSRDHFWIQHAMRMLAQKDEEVALLVDFVAKQRLEEPFARWKKKQGKSRKPASRKKKAPSRSRKT